MWRPCSSQTKYVWLKNQFAALLSFALLDIQSAANLLTAGLHVVSDFSLNMSDYSLNTNKVTITRLAYALAIDCKFGKVEMMRI